MQKINDDSLKRKITMPGLQRLFRLYAYKALQVGVYGRLAVPAWRQ